MTNVLLRMGEWAISPWEDNEMKTEAELKVIHTATSQGSQEMVEHSLPGAWRDKKRLFPQVSRGNKELLVH